MIDRGEMLNLRRRFSFIYMENSMSFAYSLLETDYNAIGIELLNRLALDQHLLYHDGEFHTDCYLCDQEREEYGL